MMKTILGGEGERTFFLEDGYRLRGTASDARLMDLTNSRLFIGVLLPAYSTVPGNMSKAGGFP
jgi:hypothetical protein